MKYFKYVLIVFATFILINCTGKKNKEKSLSLSLVPQAIATDTTFMFNGKTLDGWEITNFGPQGPVYISGNEIILGMGEGCTGITYKKDFPEKDYKVTLEAKRVSGNDFFCGMTFPVGKDPCTLIIGGWGGAVVGLSSIDKKDASENETTKLMSFESNRWYRICLMVQEDTIKALIDDEVVVDFAVENKMLSIRPEVELSKPFGITSWYTTAALRNIKVEDIKK